MTSTQLKRWSLVLSLIILVSVSVNVFAEEAKVVWRLGGAHSVGTPETIGIYYFAKLVEEKTNGEMKIEVYPAGQLGDAVGSIENVIIGAQEMYANGMDWSVHVVNDFGIFASFFVFSSLDHMIRFLETDRYKQMEQEMINKGIRILAKNWYRLPRVLLTKFPVLSMEDVKGHTFRMPALETYFKVWEKLGVNPVEIPWAETYTALDRGLADGTGSPLGSIYGMGFYREAPFITLTQHMLMPFILLVNERAYQALDSELRLKLDEAAREAGDYYTEILKKKFTEEKLKMLDEGAVFVEISTRLFLQKAQEVALEFEEKGLWSKGLFDYIQSIK